MNKEQQRIAIAEACGCVLGDALGYMDPLTDLNAMHEVEKHLKSHNMERFVNKLAVIVGNELREEYQQFYKIHSTAAQRAEAFLKTIGKWVD